MSGLGRPCRRTHCRRRNGELRVGRCRRCVDVTCKRHQRGDGGRHDADNECDSRRHTMNVNPFSQRARNPVKCFSNHLRNYPQFRGPVEVIQRGCHFQLNGTDCCQGLGTRASGLDSAKLPGPFHTSTVCCSGAEYPDRRRSHDIAQCPLLRPRRRTVHGRNAREVPEDANRFPSRPSNSASDEKFSIVASCLLVVAP